MKTLLYITEHEPIAILVRGDHDVNEIKVKRLLGVTDFDLAAPDKVQELIGAPVGYAGPVGLKGARILADQSIKHLRNFVVGANKADTHFVDANAGRDFMVDQFGDLRNAQAGDLSPRGDGTLKTAKESKSDMCSCWAQSIVKPCRQNFSMRKDRNSWP